MNLSDKTEIEKVIYHTLTKRINSGGDKMKLENDYLIGANKKINVEINFRVISNDYNKLKRFGNWFYENNVIGLWKVELKYIKKDDDKLLNDNRILECIKNFTNALLITVIADTFFESELVGIVDSIKDNVKEFNEIKN